MIPTKPLKMVQKPMYKLNSLTEIKREKNYSVIQRRHHCNDRFGKEFNLGLNKWCQ